MAAATEVERDGWINAIRYITNSTYTAKADAANALADNVRDAKRTASGSRLKTQKSAVTKFYRTTAKYSLHASTTDMHFIGMGSLDQCKILKNVCEIDDNYPKITAFKGDKNNREPGDLEGTDTAAPVPPTAEQATAEVGGRTSRKNRTLTKRRTLQNRRRYSTNTKGKKMRRRSRHLII